MNEKDKIAFLRKMGYGGSSLRMAMGYKDKAVNKDRRPETLMKNHVDKEELLNLKRLFNPPIPEKKERPNYAVVRPKSNRNDLSEDSESKA
jgi:hypothetical protein